MSRKRNAFIYVVGLSTCLAVALLAAAAIFSFTYQVSAQQGLTTSTPSAPTLTAEASGSSVELSWNAVTGATRYELWTWTSANGWRNIGGDSLTGTTYTHTVVTDGTTY